jgi:hypothetical protein
VGPVILAVFAEDGGFINIASSKKAEETSERQRAMPLTIRYLVSMYAARLVSHDGIMTTTTRRANLART